MQIIDAHVHTSFFTRPDFKKYEGINKGLTFTKAGLLAEMEKNDVVHVVTPTATRTDPGLIEEAQFGKIKHKRITILAGLNPGSLTPAVLKRAEQYLQDGTIGGFKIYLGYYHVGINFPGYKPFFRLAQKYGAPVLIHTGDTFYKTAKLKYSHPLTVDDVAVDFPDTTFVMAHLGYPWFLDAAEVLYKNDNVYADLSGLTLGPKYPTHLRQRLLGAIEYVENPEKFLYGTDWPLAPMKQSITFMKKVIPKSEHRKFFYANAKKVYNIK